MIIIENVKNEVAILQKLICNGSKDMYKTLKEKNVGIIDIDYSLLRYLAKALVYKSMSINKSGYPTIARDDNKTTTLGRFILEYYSKYDEELKQILINTEYEINHKNRNKLDNRLENLEIVTHSDNIKHSKGTSYEVLYSTDKLKQLQEQNIQDKQQIVDEQYLKRMSGLFYSYMKNNILNESLLKCCYLKFKVIKNEEKQNSSNSTNTNKKIDLNNYKLMTIFYTKKLINLECKKRKMIYKDTIDNNIKLLKRYVKRYPYLTTVLKKFKILDLDYKEEPNFVHSNTRNLLIDLYTDVYYMNKYTIKDGNILSIISLETFFDVKGKYKSFHVAYLLGLLQRRKVVAKPNTMSIYDVHTPSFIWIPKYTNDLLKQANEIAKKILQLKLNRFTYFIVAEIFGEDLADRVYRNDYLKLYYKKCLKTKDEIFKFIKDDKDVHIHGFMTKEDIFDHLQFLYPNITNGIWSFITPLLLYNTDFKQVLDDLELAYITLNKNTIESIKKHQKEYELKFTIDLKPGNKAIVLKKLIK